jgi:hypothetical protein
MWQPQSMTKPRAITPVTLGSWLIKGSREAASIDELLRTDFSSVTGWCLRRTYRAGLVRSGQPVLFWLSGDDSTSPAGIYAQGLTTGHAGVDPTRQGSRNLIMPVQLKRLDPPILRSELLQHPVLSRMEVIKMAAGSNPSFLTRDQVAELRSSWPQVTVANRSRVADDPGG